MTGQNSNNKMADTDKSKKLSRWYFGGLGSAGAACCTHPLDLLKVNGFCLLSPTVILMFMFTCVGTFTNATRGKSVCQPFSRENCSRTRRVLVVHGYFSVFVSSTVILDRAIWYI